ncbi:SDR family NAD(P)-dependent oxidoreductase [Micromonospora cathayae]|uniref:SDR family NAD(P)-dependent oxidoreductase n=1 Tax=Micromonospora cathayae TaxID=3028804 RepID=A0ABY7ZUX2_9ACTN|nr:SDR family NAD(P)-dependent oxidoreductase [Micromonospora sp. HUAS 3]WDZ86298.1 SDR family NAD(P)-dependent oxidoreductase [Micromonospora sp. HUAS 3]
MSGVVTPAARPVAVVTGAAGGLGHAIAAALHADGWQVLLTDLDGAAVAEVAAPLGGWSRALDVRDAAACAAVAAEADGAAVAIEADGAAVAAEADRAAVAIEAGGRGDGSGGAGEPGGRLGLWVNNAGILVTGPSWEQDEATRRRVIEVNALGAMNGTLAALEIMRGQGRGHVLNVVSLAGLVAPPGETVYAASKHALLAFSLGTLADLRSAGYRDVHVSCLCPDGIWTPMLHDRLDDPGAVASFTGTLLTPQRVARRAVRLARRPRPVVTLPRWRGAQVRLLDALPGLALRLGPLVRAVGRAGQRRQRRRTAGT